MSNAVIPKSPITDLGTATDPWLETHTTALFVNGREWTYDAGLSNFSGSNDKIIYFNDSLNGVKVASLGQLATFIDSQLGTTLKASNNLSDVPNKSTARTNLGLGSLATLSSITGSQITIGSIDTSKLSNPSGSGSYVVTAISTAPNGRVASWNAAGDIVDSGIAVSSVITTTSTSTLTGKTINPANNTIDADVLFIDFSPTNYTRSIPAEASNLSHLSSHLKGIDNKLAAANTFAALTDVTVTYAGSENKILTVNDGGEGMETLPSMLFETNAIKPTAAYSNAVSLGAADQFFKDAFIKHAGIGIYDNNASGANYNKLGIYFDTSNLLYAIDTLKSGTATLRPLMFRYSGSNRFIVDSTSNSTYVNLLPYTDNAVDLGEGAKRFANIYLSAAAVVNGSIFEGYKTGASEPSTSNFGTDKDWGVYKKTGGALYIAANDGGTIKKHALGTRFKTLFLKPKEFKANTTSGATGGQLETTTNATNFDYFEFSNSSTNRISTQIVMPEDWNLGVVKAKIYWTNGATTSSGSVRFAVSSYAFSDNDTLDTATSGDVAITDAFLTAGKQHITAASGDITIQGSPTKDDLIVFEVERDPNNNDNYEQSVRFLGILIQYQTTDDYIAGW